MSVWQHIVRISAGVALAGLASFLADVARANSADAVEATDPALVCGQLIGAAEKALGMPEHLMRAVGVVESGRYDRTLKRAEPWPWTINVAGKGHVFATKAEAIAAVEAAQRAGTTSIDVGCMQVNLAYHGSAFVSLDEAFDPVMNVAYAAHFLTTLHADRGSWNAAVAAYHSSTPERALPYRQKVARTWLDMRTRMVADIVNQRRAKIIETHRQQRAAFEARQAERQREQMALRSIRTWPEIAPPDSLVTEIRGRRAAAEAAPTARTESDQLIGGADERDRSAVGRIPDNCLDTLVRQYQGHGPGVDPKLVQQILDIHAAEHHVAALADDGFVSDQGLDGPGGTRTDPVDARSSQTGPERDDPGPISSEATTQASGAEAEASGAGAGADRACPRLIEIKPARRHNKARTPSVIRG